MKRRQGLSLLLAAVMLLSLVFGAVPAQAAQEDAPARTDAGEPVRMIVELEEPKAFPLNLFAPTPTRQDVKDAICDLVEKASPLSADGETAPEVTFGYDYSVLLQGFSLTAPEGYLEEIRALKGVRNAFKAQAYTLVEPEGGEPLEDFYPFEGDATLYAHWEPIGAPTEPTEPAEPTVPTEPTEPTESTEPTEPIVPTEPAEPITPDVSPCDGGANCPSKVFTDVDRTAKSWYHEAVDWAVVQKITNGRDLTHFAPKEICTRAEAVTFLWRAAGSPAVQNVQNPFTDVKESSYYYNAVLWAVQEGITNGVSADAFAPSAKCTRAHIVTFLFRAAGAQPAAGADNPFTDVPENTWYTDGVLWAAAEGVTNGDGRADIFHPHQGCSRAMIVTFLYRAQ